MLIGLTADLHLDKRLGNRRDEHGVNVRSRDLEAATSRVIDGFIRDGVDVAVIAGDLFDNARPSERSRQFLIRELRRLDAALPNATKILLRGNHDTIMSYSDATVIGTIALALPGFVVADAYEVVVVERDEFAFTLVPWMRSDAEFLATIESLSPPPNKRNILIMHCGMADLPEYAELRPGSQTLTRSLVPADRFEWIFSGHFHGYKTIPDLRWTFIGSPERLSVAEVNYPNKGYLVYDSNKPGEAGISQRVIATRAWYDIGKIDGRNWDGQRLLTELRSIAKSLPDWEQAIVRLKIEHLRPDVYASYDRVAFNAIRNSAFYADIELSVDHPIFESSDDDAENPILLEDLEAEWKRYVATMAERSAEEIERITRLGLAAMNRGDLEAALSGEDWKKDPTLKESSSIGSKSESDRV